MNDDLPMEVRLRLPERDPRALEIFFDHYYERVHRYLSGLVRSAELAEDLTQDVFLQIHRALPGYDPQRPTRPWVFTAAVHRARDHWRSRSRQEQARALSLAGEEGEALDVEDEGARPELPLEALEDAERVRALVDALPEGMRACLLLRIFEELPFSDVAEALGVSEVAARKRYSRALVLLRERLSEPGGVGGGEFL